MQCSLAGKKILLGITGGIAAYKSLFLIQELKRLGAEVRVILTESARQFVTAYSAQVLSGSPVSESLWDKDAELAMGHIELARWADILLVAPASANTLAKMAHGLADNLLTTCYLATRAQVIVCPAMNQAMWRHPASKANITKLKEQGVTVFGPDEGEQACGDIGPGRMLEPAEIAQTLMYADLPKVLAGRHVVISAGPTREYLDPVRYLSNESSGKMGYALARAASAAGARVTLVSGPTNIPLPFGIESLLVKSAEEMRRAVFETLTPQSIFIASAAVADYRPVSPAEQKIKKQAGSAYRLEVCENPDIVAEVARSKKAAYVLAFAAETENLLEYAHAKRQKKGVDAIIANPVGFGRGFGEDANEAMFISAEQTVALGRQHKSQLAKEIIAILGSTLHNSQLMNQE